jgi:hypothetical protein
MLMQLHPQFAVGCQLWGNSASRLEAFHAASTKQMLPITPNMVCGLVVSAATEHRKQFEDDTWEDNPRYADASGATITA